MTASYPSAVKSFATRIDFTDIIYAEHVNSLQDEVNSLESNLGTNVNVGSGWVGSFDQITTNWNTLKDRIANIEYGLNAAYAAKLPSGGTTGQVLVKSSNSNYAVSWTTGDFLPSQTGNNGKYLTTDGSSASWETVDSLPSQTGNNGKYLTTDGSAASWATVSSGATDVDNFSQFLLSGC